MRSRAAPTNSGQLSRLADMAAERAVQKAFMMMGVDISTPSAVIEAQELFSSMRGLKRDWAIFRNRLIVGFAAMVCTVAAAIVFHWMQAPKPPI